MRMNFVLRIILPMVMAVTPTPAQKKQYAIIQKQKELNTLIQEYNENQKQNEKGMIYRDGIYASKEYWETLDYNSQKNNY